MEKKSSPGLILCCFLATVFHLEAKLEITVYMPGNEKSWDDARQYCQYNYIDMVSSNTVNLDDLADWLEKKKVNDVWIGLHQDLDLAWRWIDVR